MRYTRTLLFMIFGFSMNAAAQVSTTDSAFIHDSRPIIPFVVGKKDIEQQDRKWITNYLIPKLKALGDSGIIIGRASASPEGSLQINTQLANARKASMNALLSSYGINTNLIRYDVVPMDFPMMRALMKLRKDDYLPVVDSLMTQYAADVMLLKEAMIRQDRGKLWLHLYHNYFPCLRSVRIMAINRNLADAGKVQENIKPQPSEAETLQKDSLLHAEKKEIEIEKIEEIEKTEKIEKIEKEETEGDERRELMSVKTNLLFELAYMPGYNRFCPIPNVAIEYYPLHGHFTYGASFDTPWWKHYSKHKYFQLRNYQVHTRYYLRRGDIEERKPGKGAAFKGFFFSAYAHAYLYNICFSEKRGWEGEGWGAGIGAGYVMPIDRKEHWRLEFGLQLGYLNTLYDPYQWRCPVDPGTDIDRYYYKWYGNAKDFKKRQHSYSWIGPTRVEITLSYDLIYRHKERK